jgi:hypothetical protein
LFLSRIFCIFLDNRKKGSPTQPGLRLNHLAGLAIIDWKAGVYTPRLASVKFITAEKVVKPIFGLGYDPQEPAHRFAGEGTINFLSNEDTGKHGTFGPRLPGACPGVLH